jgi:hypothetical protein
MPAPPLDLLIHSRGCLCHERIGRRIQEQDGNGVDGENISNAVEEPGEQIVQI